MHHHLNGAEPFAALSWSRILATWQGRRPKLHYAEQDLTKRPGADSDYLNAAHFRAFCHQVPLDEYDVMLECKAKEQALLRLRADLAGMGADSFEKTIFRANYSWAFFVSSTPKKVS